MGDNEYYAMPEDNSQAQPQSYYPSVQQPEMTAEQLRYLLDSDVNNERIENYLRGKIYDLHKQQYIKKYTPLMNEIGINRIMFLLYSHTDTGSKLTHIEKSNSREIVCQFCEVLHEDLIKRHVEYELDFNDIPLVSTMVCNQVFNSYCRGEEGFQSSFLRGIMYMGFNEGNGYNGMNGNNQKRSILGMFNPFNKRGGKYGYY